MYRNQAKLVDADEEIVYTPYLNKMYVLIVYNKCVSILRYGIALYRHPISR